MGDVAQVRDDRHNPLCMDCSGLRVREPSDDDAFKGRRVLVGGVWKFVPEMPPVRFAARCRCGDYYPPDGSCEACSRWAENDARLHAEARESWANRHVIWDILDARKERVDAA